MSFQWGKMNATPAGALERKQSKMSVPELVALFEGQIIRDLETGEVWNELIRSVTDSLAELTDEGAQAEITAERIVDRFQKFLTDEKGIEDRKEQIAYVIALAHGILKKRDRAH